MARKRMENSDNSRQIVTLSIDATYVVEAKPTCVSPGAPQRQHHRQEYPHT